MKKAFRIGTLVTVLALIGSISYGAALTSNRDTKRRSGIEINVGVATNTRVFAGSMVAVNSSGFIVPASDASAIKVIGRAALERNNLVGATDAGDNGAFTVDIRIGIFAWGNASTVLTDEDIGRIVYVLDDNSVTNGPGSNAVVAGKLVDVTSDGAWVLTGHIEDSEIRERGSFVFTPGGTITQTFASAYLIEPSVMLTYFTPQDTGITNAAVTTGGVTTFQATGAGSTTCKWTSVGIK